MAEAGRFLAGGTKIVLRDDSVEQDPEAVLEHLERIGRIWRRSLREEETRKQKEIKGAEQVKEEREGRGNLN